MRRSEVGTKMSNDHTILRKIADNEAGLIRTSLGQAAAGPTTARMEPAPRNGRLSGHSLRRVRKNLVVRPMTNDEGGREVSSDPLPFED